MRNEEDKEIRGNKDKKDGKLKKVCAFGPRRRKLVRFPLSSAAVSAEIWTTGQLYEVLHSSSALYFFLQLSNHVALRPLTIIFYCDCDGLVIAAFGDPLDAIRRILPPLYRLFCTQTARKARPTRLRPVHSAGPGFAVETTQELLKEFTADPTNKRRPFTIHHHAL